MPDAGCTAHSAACPGRWRCPLPGGPSCCKVLRRALRREWSRTLLRRFQTKSRQGKQPFGAAHGVNKPGTLQQKLLVPLHKFCRPRLAAPAQQDLQRSQTPVHVTVPLPVFCSIVCKLLCCTQQPISFQVSVRRQWQPPYASAQPRTTQWCNSLTIFALTSLGEDSSAVAQTLFESSTLLQIQLLCRGQPDSIVDLSLSANCACLDRSI